MSVGCPAVKFLKQAANQLIIGGHHEFTVGVEGEGSCFAMRVVHPLLIGH